MILFHLSTEETYIGFELQWDARTEPLKLWNSSDSRTNLVALVSFFKNVCKLKKIKILDYSSKVYLYVTCFQKKNHTKCVVEGLAKSLVLQSSSFAKLSAL